MLALSDRTLRSRTEATVENATFHVEHHRVLHWSPIGLQGAGTSYGRQEWSAVRATWLIAISRSSARNPGGLPRWRAADRIESSRFDPQFEQRTGCRARRQPRALVTRRS